MKKRFLSTEYSYKRLLTRSGLLLSAAVLALGPLTLTGCSTMQEETSQAQRVINAAQDEVQGCTFIQELTIQPRATMGNARHDLKLKAAQAGATHVVETFAYTAPINRLTRDMYGIALTGRSYLCPAGTGPTKDNLKAQARLKEDIPHPEVNDDDPFYHLMY